ncbi:hypothetical protein RHYP_2850 [Rhus yellows phytoplasma]|uniref:Uncharacterized protein n=1 Tax=Rhus yellows phytoplasma TaxID=1225349 RepID=A0ABQ5PSU5_9MOLU|nr:hypothetical protein RHYP_2850 [Rhus yellows phytoplasma]
MKLFSYLFDFLIQILNIFLDIVNSIIGYITYAKSFLTDIKQISVSESLWDKIVEIVKVVFTVTVGSTVIYYLKEVTSFLLNAFTKIADLLFKNVLKIMNIIEIILKYFLFLLQKVIIILGFFLSFFINLQYLWVFKY